MAMAEQPVWQISLLLSKKHWFWQSLFCRAGPREDLGSSSFQRGSSYDAVCTSLRTTTGFHHKPRNRTLVTSQLQVWNNAWKKLFPGFAGSEIQTTVRLNSASIQAALAFRFKELASPFIGIRTHSLIRSFQNTPRPSLSLPKTKAVLRSTANPSRT